MKTLDLSVFAEFAAALADISGAMLRQAGEQVRNVHVKADASPVTDTDRAVERALREKISASYPDHGILGEEFDDHLPDAEFTWIIDPIDGTKQFLAAIPVYGTLIALAHRGIPVLGVIDHPITAQRWIGVDNIGSFCNGERVHTRSCDGLPNALLAVSSPDYFEPHARQLLTALSAATRWCVYGGSCYAYARIASGFIDLAIDTDFDIFDYCAIEPVIRNAGGVMSDWQGRPLTIHSGLDIVASGDAKLHADALVLIKMHS